MKNKKPVRTKKPPTISPISIQPCAPSYANKFLHAFTASGRARVIVFDANRTLGVYVTEEEAVQLSKWFKDLSKTIKATPDTDDECEGEEGDDWS